YRSPEALADAAATFVWLHFTNPLNDGELEYVKNSEHGSDLERMHYGMATAWRALYPGKARDFYIIGSEPKYQTAKELKSTAKMWAGDQTGGKLSTRSSTRKPSMTDEKPGSSRAPK